MIYQNQDEGYIIYVSISEDKSCSSITIKSEVDELTHEDILHILAEFAFYYEDNIKQDLVEDAIPESSTMN